MIAFLLNFNIFILCCIKLYHNISSYSNYYMSSFPPLFERTMFNPKFSERGMSDRDQLKRFFNVAIVLVDSSLWSYFHFASIIYVYDTLYYIMSSPFISYHSMSFKLHTIKPFRCFISSLFINQSPHPTTKISIKKKLTQWLK